MVCFWHMDSLLFSSYCFVQMKIFSCFVQITNSGIDVGINLAYRWGNPEYAGTCLESIYRYGQLKLNTVGGLGEGRGSHLNSCGFTWSLLDSHGPNWFHLSSHDLTWTYLHSLGFPWFLLSPRKGNTWSHKGIGKESLRPNGAREKVQKDFWDPFWP